MAIDALELISETTGRALRNNTVNAARVRVDKDTGDLVQRDQNGNKRKYTVTKSVENVLQGAAPATAANYGIFFTAPWACKVTSIVERHETAGTDAGAVTMQVAKVPSGTAKGSGTSLLQSTGFNLKSTADTNVTGTLVTNTATLTLAAGDSLALIPTGVLTALAGLCVTVGLEKV